MIELPLYDGTPTLIDDEDLPLVDRWAWHHQILGGGLSYARRSNSRGRRPRTIYMHRVIMNAPSGLVVDHIDGNGLNNQRSNLRVVTARENLWNRRDKRRFE